MYALAERRSGKQQIPEIIRLDTLLGLLALDTSADGFNADEFAPLISVLLQQDLRPTSSEFTSEDLEWLLDIDTSSESLTPEQRNEQAVVIAKGRLAGKDKRDTELNLEIQRTTRRFISDDEKLLEEVTAEAQQSAEHNEELREELVGTKSEIHDLKDSAKQDKLSRSRLQTAVGALIFAVVMLVPGLSVFFMGDSTQTLTIAGVFLAVSLTSIGTAVGAVFWRR